jgi:hypothetical protein
MADKRFQLTPDQLALAQIRQSKKQQEQQPTTIAIQDRGHILARQWIQLEPINRTDTVQRVKFFTWNVRPFQSVMS